MSGAINQEALKKIIESASDAFWAKVAEQVPEVTTGDLPPDALGLWHENCKAIVKRWLEINLPEERETGQPRIVSG